MQARPTPARLWSEGLQNNFIEKNSSVPRLFPSVKIYVFTSATAEPVALFSSKCYSQEMMMCEIFSLKTNIFTRYDAG